jgi:3-methyladenine DNA glycosylase AlkD
MDEHFAVRPELLVGARLRLKERRTTRHFCSVYDGSLVSERSSSEQSWHLRILIVPHRREWKFSGRNQITKQIKTSPLLQEIQSDLRRRAKQSVKASAQKFVPTSQRVYGVTMPEVNELAKKYKSGGFQLTEKLWKSGAFEERMLAAKLLRFFCKKDPERSLRQVKRWSKDIQDWAVCDTLGMQSLKPIARLSAEDLFAVSESLVKSKNLWQRRLSLVLVEELTKYPEHHARIRKLVARLRSDDEYYVKKAVGWLDRNLKKRIGRK